MNFALSKNHWLKPFQNIANPKNAHYKQSHGTKMPHYPARHHLGFRGQRGVKVSTILAKGVFDTPMTKIFDIMECEGHPKLWVKVNLPLCVY
jgi:hypothetical protein